jgi:hypothetical protein
VRSNIVTSAHELKRKFGQRSDFGQSLFFNLLSRTTRILVAILFHAPSLYRFQPRKGFHKSNALIAFGQTLVVVNMATAHVLEHGAWP